MAADCASAVECCAQLPLLLRVELRLPPLLRVALRLPPLLRALIRLHPLLHGTSTEHGPRVLLLLLQSMATVYLHRAWLKSTSTEHAHIRVYLYTEHGPRVCLQNFAPEYLY